MGYSPWGCKESDMNEQPTLSLSLWASLVAQMVKNQPGKNPGFDAWVGKIPWRTELQNSRILAWRIPRTEETGVTKSWTRLSEHLHFFHSHLEDEGPIPQRQNCWLRLHS